MKVYDVVKFKTPCYGKYGMVISTEENVSMVASRSNAVLKYDLDVKPVTFDLVGRMKKVKEYSQKSSGKRFVRVSVGDIVIDVPLNEHVISTSRHFIFLEALRLMETLEA